MADDLDEIGATLRELSATIKSPKDLMTAVRKRYPKASKKIIVRAAFRSVIVNADRDIEAAEAMQDFAVKGRGSSEFEETSR